MGLYCSNVFSEYISGVLSGDDCEKSLKAVIDLANRCDQCLMNNLPCSYDAIDKQCHVCLEKNIECVSLVVFHVLWDMGSSHKATAKRSNKITETSSDAEFRNPQLHSIGFGGLHLAKSPTNFLRNNVLCMSGQNYGLNILRALRNCTGDHSAVLANVKAAILVGKDRQSDYLSYSTTSSTVQESLKLAKNYKCVRVPETVLAHTENAKKQKKIVMPTGIQCNKNGDVFVLDSGGSCIHAIDRSSVAKDYIFGNYLSPCTEMYKENNIISASSVKLSNVLNDIFVPQDRDDIFVVDSGRHKVIIIRNCSVAKKITSSHVNILKKQNIRSLCYFNNNFVFLCRNSTEDCIQIIDFDLPPLRKDSPLEVTGKTLKKIKISEQIKYVFSISATVVGLVTEQQEVLFYFKPGSSNCQIIQSTGIKTVIKPQTQDSLVSYLSPYSEQLNHLNVTTQKKGNKVLFIRSEKVVSDIPTNTRCLAIWGCTCYIVSNVNGFYKVIEYGSLDFGLKFSEHLNLFYNAISYNPPHGQKSLQKKTLQDAIGLATPFVNTLSSMQKEREEIFPSRKSFVGTDGTVFTDTFRCIKSTVDSWKAVVQRLEHFDATLLDKVNPHTVTNEALIEHSFGFTKGKGQSELQTMQEYIHNKQKHEIDFQLRLCKTTFCQHVKIKLRDKSYQQLDEQFHSKLDMDDIWNILFSQRKKKNQPDNIDDADARLLYQAYLLTKSVPRRSNRAKWKEESGYAPNMLVEQVDQWKLLKGDLVFCRDPITIMKKLVVMEEKMMKNVDDLVMVEDVENSSTESVSINTLLKDKGQIFVIPSSLYEISGNVIKINDIASQVLQNCIDSDTTASIYTDDEMSQLPVDTDDSLIISDEIPHPISDSSDEVCVGPSRSKKVTFSDSSEDESLVPSKSKKAKLISDDDDDDDNDDEEPQVGYWIVSKFLVKSKVNYYLGQIIRSEIDDQFCFQFYRCQNPNEHVYVKLKNEEIQHVSCIVQQVHKDDIDILSGDKVKLLRDMNMKLV